MKLFKAAIVSTLFLSLNLFASDDDAIPERGGTGTVTIITDPPNSDVYLGGENLGKSPIQKKPFKSGRHTLIVIDQGHELVNERFNVFPNKENTYQAKTVIPKGHVEITTIPGKCLVYVDGDNADRTDGAPLTVKNLDAGDHLIRVECSNGRSAEEMVTIKGEETIQITLDATSKKSKKK